MPPILWQGDACYPITMAWAMLNKTLMTENIHTPSAAPEWSEYPVETPADRPEGAVAVNRIHAAGDRFGKQKPGNKSTNQEHRRGHAVGRMKTGKITIAQKMPMKKAH